MEKQYISKPTRNTHKGNKHDLKNYRSISKPPFRVLHKILMGLI